MLIILKISKKDYLKRIIIVKIQNMFKEVLRKVPLGGNLLHMVFDEQNTVADEKSLGNSA